MPRQNRTTLAAALVLVWLIGTAFGFWWFQFKDLRPFAVNTANKNIFFDGEKMRNHLNRALEKNKDRGRPDDKVTTVVHFWDPACDCSRFNEKHVRDLMAEYRKQGIRFVVVARAESFANREALSQKARAVFGDVDVIWNQDLRLNKSIPSSPAAIILDGQQQLAYFGPYSEGAVCSAGSGRFVERILDGVLAGKNPQFINTLAYGCFCDWQKQG